MFHSKSEAFDYLQVSFNYWFTNQYEIGRINFFGGQYLKKWFFLFFLILKILITLNFKIIFFLATY